MKIQMSKSKCQVNVKIQMSKSYGYELMAGSDLSRRDGGLFGAGNLSFGN